MYTMYIIELLLLVGGGLLCSRGLKVYRIMQMIICGCIGAYIGLHIGYSIGREELYLLALILTVVGGYLGYRHYKVSLFATASICSFMVVFSYFWKKAIAIANDSVAQVMKIKDIVETGTKGQASVKDTGQSITKIMALQGDNVAAISKAAADVVRHGLFVAVIVGIVTGVLTLWFGDYIIMLFTAAFGSLLLVYLVEIFITVPPMAHVAAILAVTIVGLMLQFKYCK